LGTALASRLIPKDNFLPQNQGALLAAIMKGIAAAGTNVGSRGLVYGGVRLHPLSLSNSILTPPSSSGPYPDPHHDSHQLQDPRWRVSRRRHARMEEHPLAHPLRAHVQLRRLDRRDRLCVPEECDRCQLCPSHHSSWCIPERGLHLRGSWICRCTSLCPCPFPTSRH
jgi:hypothetical protein